MSDLYIFDLDGTLADCEHRTHYISGPKKDWTSFFNSCQHDAPIESGLKTLRALRRGGADIWIWTGRSDMVRRQTIEWLIDNEVLDPRPGRIDELHGVQTWLKMRRAHDFRTDHVLKAEWLSAMAPKDRARLVAVFEDRAGVVQMWREAGVPCFQVAPGEF